MDYIEYKEYVQNIDSGYTLEPLYTPIILHKSGMLFEQMISCNIIKIL